MPRLEEELNCVGYMGLGTGWTLGKANTPQTQKISGKDVYCSALCSKSKECWAAHRRKMQLRMPRACMLFDAMQDQHGQEKAMHLWQQLAKEKNKLHPHMANKLPEVDPYFLGMQQHIQDGYAIAQTGKPINRGRWTLKWPFLKS